MINEGKKRKMEPSKSTAPTVRVAVGHHKNTVVTKIEQINYCLHQSDFRAPKNKVSHVSRLRCHHTTIPFAVATIPQGLV